MDAFIPLIILTELYFLFETVVESRNMLKRLMVDTKATRKACTERKTKNTGWTWLKFNSADRLTKLFKGKTHVETPRKRAAKLSFEAMN